MHFDRISGNEILYMGDGEGVRDYIGDTTQRYDLAGKMLLPGFHDA